MQITDNKYIYLCCGRFGLRGFGRGVEGRSLGLTITVMARVLVDMLHHLGVRETTGAKRQSIEVLI